LPIKISPLALTVVDYHHNLDSVNQINADMSKENVAIGKEMKKSSEESK
jgi:hypothetical protein